MLKGSRRLWGDDHPETQLALAGLGALFAVQGNYGESEVLLSTALEYRRRTLGDGHPKTLVSMSNLGNVLSLARKHEAAEMLLAEALDVTPNAPEPGATPPTGGPTYRTHAYLHEHGKVQRQMSLPPAEAEGSPIVTWVELCQ